MKVKYINFEVEFETQIEKRLNEELKRWQIKSVIYFSVKQPYRCYEVTLVGEL